LDFLMTIAENSLTIWANIESAELVIQTVGH
jgi:hypothetical protein